MKTKPVHIMMAIAILGGFLIVTSFKVNDFDQMKSQLVDRNFSNPGAGITTTIPAYYDAKIYNIQFKQLSSQAAATLIAKNGSINFIYQSDPGLPGGLPFISVIDAIPTDGMNPVWREVQIVFNPGFTPVQFYRDDDVLAAAASSPPQITLVYTDEVYSCPVMGIK